MIDLEKYKYISLTRFLEEIDQDYVWIIKRLSGNDTGLTGGHQAGTYFPKDFFKFAVPELYNTFEHNPDRFIDKFYFPEQDIEIQDLRIIYYNSKYFPEKGNKKKYDEFRVTRWGGVKSPNMDIENTGSIFIFAIHKNPIVNVALGWVASSITSETMIEEWIGSEIEPGIFFSNAKIASESNNYSIPEIWKTSFPNGNEIFNYVLQLLPRKKWNLSVDKLLLERRKLEFSIFKDIESKHVLPKIINGFDDIDSFLKIALSVANRRKSRTGSSLERNLESIFSDEEIRFETQVITENRKKPDFIFPGGQEYHRPDFPEKFLHMMAAKTCCKDRWRQVINEADRIKEKHLFTLQEGISANQLKEMYDHDVKLVVPEPNLKKFPQEWREDILSLNSFVQFIKTKQTHNNIWIP